MVEVFVAFITGLTTGGLSCLAVQGGLLASSVARQVEEDVRNQPRASRPGTRASRLATRASQPAASASQPILLFLAAKIVAYTLLGLLLGWIGSVLQLTAVTRAFLQLGIGIFMIGTALRMLNVHPIFRYFVLEPPAAVTRYIRRKSKIGSNVVTPLALGALTVFIPCGVTLAMMAVAVGSGQPLLGAAIMFSFTLGASPVFFLVAYLATRLGAAMEKYFLRLVAVVVLVLGLVSIETGLNLMGSPYSFASMTRSLRGEAASASLAPTSAPTFSTSALVFATAPAASSDASANELTINVTGRGYAPAVSQAKANQPLQLKLVTKQTYGCARAFVIPALGVEQILPATGTTVIDVPAQPAGSVLFFSCSMGMYSGQIRFD